MPDYRAPEHPDAPGPDVDLSEVYLLDRRSAREVDRLAVERYGMPSLLLMENAARHLADAALDVVEAVDTPRIFIVCGPGNNGGDGLAAARHLHNARAEVVLLLTAEVENFRNDAGANAAIVSRMGLPVRVVSPRDPVGSAESAAEELGRPDLIIDAIFGTGLDRPVAEPVASLIGWINARHKDGVAVLAADVPSGLDADTGAPLGCAVSADVTVTFAGLKAGFITLAAQEYVGDVVVADIGVPRELLEHLGTRLARHADASPSVTLRREPRRPLRPGQR